MKILSNSKEQQFEAETPVGSAPSNGFCESENFHAIEDMPIKRNPSFSSHPEYLKIVQMRQVASSNALQDPFFRIHETRAGPTTQIDGQKYINFSSYDYLGLNQDPRVAAAANHAIDQYGTSASASRLVAGERNIHRELEHAIADYHGVEDSVVFVSGHATNVSTIATIMGKGDLVIYDELAHNSIVMGALMSGAARRVYPHNDIDALQTLLENNRGSFKNVLVAVEGLYSMDGDTPDLSQLVELRKQFGFWLMVDEAHSTGVLGPTGGGISEMYNVDPTEIDIWMGTLSKTCASCGGYIAGSSALVEIIKANASGFVYSVGLSPPLAAAALKSFEILMAEPERVRSLQENGKHFLQSAKAAGLQTGFSEGYCIVPVIVGDPIRAVRLSETLFGRGFNVSPVIYPAVAMSTSRLRYFISSLHTKEQIESVISATKEGIDKLSN